MKPAQNRMHNQIARALIVRLADELGKMKPAPEIQVYIEKRMDAIWENVPIRVGKLVPDGIILVKESKKSKRKSQCLIVEFARSYSATPKALEAARAFKRNAYHTIETYLRRRLEEEVKQVPLIMSILAISNSIC